MTHARILYAIDILPTDDIRARMPRARQSAAASNLAARLEEMCPSPTTHSRSHSRAIVTAALGTAPGLAIGIDVEWMAPDRPFDSIAQMFLASAPAGMTADAFYRGWTFSEAYYKALGHFPAEALIREAVTEKRKGGRLLFADGTQALQARVEADFCFCLVWRHASGETEVVRALSGS